jgi:hypothetical protein
MTCTNTRCQPCGDRTSDDIYAFSIDCKEMSEGENRMCQWMLNNTGDVVKMVKRGTPPCDDQVGPEFMGSYTMNSQHALKNLMYNVASTPRSSGGVLSRI